ncbi:hypothetical protein CEE39_06785 [bacterium (candidate division B38) B3_B38]|nr:MAG: hypothetical protein CEE39_06785 [bacterium (candidate division B38) B3_B38]
MKMETKGGIMSTLWRSIICLVGLSFLFLLLTLFFSSDSATLGDSGDERSFKKLYHESFAAPEGTEVYLDADGRVELEVWDKPEVDVTVDYNVREKYLWKRSRRGEREYGVEMYKSGNRIVIKAKHPRVAAFGFYSVRRDNHYQLKVPPYVELDIHGDDDPISISGVQGAVEVEVDDGELWLQRVDSPRIRIRSHDGDIILKDVTAKGSLDISGDDGDIEIYDTRAEEVSVQNDDGNIELSNVKGEIRLNTNDGRIELIAADTSKLEIEGDDGRVRVETTIYPGGTYRIRTDDGSIYLTIPGDCSATFDATTDGSFKFDLPIKAEKISHGHMRGSLGKGEATIRLSSADGNITISAR